jgi:hypothetical protein
VRQGTAGRHKAGFEESIPSLHSGVILYEVCREGPKREGKRVKHFEIFGMNRSSYAEPENRNNAPIFEGLIKRDGSIDLLTNGAKSPSE